MLDAGDGVFFISRWDLVHDLLRDPRHGAGSGVAASFGAEQGLAFEAMRVWLMSLDGAPHLRARGLIRRAFTPRRVEELRVFIEETCEAAVVSIRGMPVGDTVELIESLAFRLPSEVIRTLFGFERAAWAQEIEAVLRVESGVPMIEALAATFEGRLREGNVPPGLLADLRVADAELGTLSDLEVVANAVLLVTAAIDTTAGLIGNAVLCVLERPEVQARLREDPGRAADVVEETLRFEPPALSCTRTAGCDFELAGVAIPAGAQLLLGLGAANRDPLRYPAPDTFDLDRDWTQLLSFGGGRHFCLGAALARLEAQIVIERLFGHDDLVLEIVDRPVWQKRNPTVRSLERLVVRIGSAG